MYRDTGKDLEQTKYSSKYQEIHSKLQNMVSNITKYTKTTDRASKRKN